MSNTAEQRAISEAADRYQAGDLDAVEALCRPVVQRNRRAVDAWQLLGLAAFNRRRWDDATTSFERCLKLMPDSARFHVLLAKVRTFEGRLDEALAGYDEALRLDPAFADAIAWKAATLERRGDYDAARALLEPRADAIDAHPDMAETMARLELHAGRAEAAAAIIARQLARPDLAPPRRPPLAFLHGRALEKAGRCDDAFAAYVDANATIAQPFDPDAWDAETDALIEIFSPPHVDGLARARTSAEPAVLIAGMPRSGTTLIEQIIDAHPAAHGGGEIKDLVEIALGLGDLVGSQRPYPECVLDLTPSAAENLGRRYRNRTTRLARKATRIVDKNLDNYRQLGLASLLLPGASIVHVHRDPLDTCWSCFASQLPAATFGWSTDLGHLGRAYRAYERLMTRWRALPDVRILDVEYETLVRDPEPTTRAIIDFCGLDWDDRCLRFFESGRFARTLSYDQVRRPVYDESIGRAQRFVAHLAPLEASLRG
jgi:tetratricopeptide (TPR) repeat protein